jgi:hypothetical protein
VRRAGLWFGCAREMGNVGGVAAAGLGFRLEFGDFAAVGC